METTMDWDGFEKQARSVAPKTPLDPRVCLIGVLDYKKLPESILQGSDFLWIKVNHGVSIEKIQRAYRQHFDLAAVRLSFKGQLVDQNDSVSSYLAPNDDLVFFTVDQARQSSEHSQPARHRERSTMEHESQQQPREISESSTSTLTIRTASLTRTSPERCIEKPGRLGIKEENASVPSVVQDTSKEAANAFDPNNVFHRERSLDGIRQAQGASYDSVLRQIIEQRDPDILEAGVNASTEIIKRLRQKFSQYAESNADSKAWMNAIENVLQQTVRTRTIVGVVGNTGAGKSSVINAMLDEERLVPTNCMRACTAVVTEISFNEDVDPSSKYRAEIEFISSEDWERELTVLMQEFTDNGTLSREAVNPNSEAGVAWAKFHAVYPCVTKDALWKHTITELVNKQSVVNTLGTVKYIRAAQPERFHQELQRYVDSKEKVSKKDKEKPKISVPKAARVMEYWPLIKVVRIYTKSPALSTGAVIVDLPGVHDSNAARAAVAQGYLKQCTGLWIVAPINRAVDDKAAKTLLGDSFKRQLKYDGGFSNMTFICSKTDDISVTEASDSLGLEDEVSELNKRYEHCDEQIRQVHAKIEDLKETRQVYKLAIAEIAKDIEIWEDFQEQIEDGIPVFAPLPKTSKRKDTSLDRRPSKKPRTFEENSDDEFIASDEDKSSEGDDNDVTILVARQKLTETDVKSKLKDLRETKKTARSEGTEINKMIEALRAEIRKLNARQDEVKAKASRICIAGRNYYSKTAIQQDFADGIKEIDQENAAEEDEDQFNPDIEIRDYAQVANSLPVFCVSSRAYQKMCGRMLKDEPVPGFVSPDETEIPQLQAHCRKLTEAGRLRISRAFLTNLAQILTRFELWLSNDGTSVPVTEESKREGISYLRRKLSELTKGLNEAVRACFKEMRHCVKTQVNDKYPELINEAVKAAPVTAYAWGYKDQGGLPWSTYKAVVRRDGVYRSMSAGHRDFNSDLVDPILKRLATPWERTFQSHLPGKIETHIENSAKLLHKFHEAIQERGNDSGMSLAKISILKGQLTHYEQFLRDFGMDLINQMNELQREANRDFTPCVAMAMHDAYEYCAMEHGKGSYKRMKDHMEDHVKQESPGMFDEATSKVEKHMDDMCTKLREAMEEKAEWFAARMGTDYMRVMSGVASDQPVPLLSEEESQLRDEVREALSSIVVQLEPIAHGDVGSHHGDTGDGSKAHKPLHAYVEDVDMSESAEEPIRGAHDSSITDEAINSVKPTDNGSSIIVEATNNFKPNTVVNESINSGKPMGNDSTAMEA
ncbi:Dynamin-N domain-containing protein [Pyrenophora tritici-repentis]|nr:Dynamin-N domain-containing protein [Pyrenophora tritici-repentis]KAI0610318.1 Dynamin-N domain-containing protein [Pyrenophora tritici-repentis]